jgi:hypothetical protein
MTAAVFGDNPDKPAAAPVDDFDAPPRPRTGLQFLREMQAARKAAKVRTVTLTDTQRPEFELICRVPSDMDEMLDLDDKAADAAKTDGAPAEAVILRCMVLARMCTVLRVYGRPTSDGTGSAFADPALHAELGIEGPGAAWRAVRQLFITDGGTPDDGIIARMADALSEASGMTRRSVVVGQPDPT